MKDLIKSAMAISIMFLIAACDNKKTTEKEIEDHDSHDTTKMDPIPNETPDGSVSLRDENLNAIYQHYVYLTTALVNSDVAEAKIAANAIEAGANEWEHGRAIALAASRISGAAGIDAQRAAYADLSNELIFLVKRSGLNKGDLYVDYCPMALNDKGAYWLSSEKEIRNPYFGQEMLTCGEVKETLK